MLSAYHRMTKEELIAEIERLTVESMNGIDLRRTVHELEVYREESRIQTEQLIESQRLLEESRDRYADLYEFAPLPYVTLDETGVIQDINLTGTTFFGRERALLIGNPFRVLVLADDTAKWLEHIRRCRHESGPIRTGMRIKTATGAINVDIFSRRSRSQDDRILRTAIIDLTDQKRAEAEVRQLNRDLEQRVQQRTAELERAVLDLRVADQRKDEFLAMLGHELRNPLAGIAHAIALLKRTGGLAAEHLTTLAVMDRQLANISRLLNDLLDVARVTRGKVVLKKQPTMLAEIIQAALAAAQPFLSARGHHVEVLLPKEPLVVDCDSARIEQVLQNLIHNAGKYTDPTGKIQIELKRKASRALIRVIDSGIGMNERELRMAFDLFSQSNTAENRAEGGLGVGLTLAKNLVELHGGTIAASSPGHGKGSVFDVYLPVHEEHEGIAFAPATVEEEPRATAALTRKILVIDDNRDAANLLSRLLELSGHTVKVAYDAGEGIQLGQQMSPDIVLLDIGLPGMSGYEVAQHLRQIPQCTKSVLVAMTGYGSDRDKQRAREAGFDHHLTKPISPDMLSKILNAVPSLP